MKAINASVGKFVRLFHWCGCPPSWRLAKCKSARWTEAVNLKVRSVWFWNHAVIFWYGKYVSSALYFLWLGTWWFGGKERNNQAVSTSELCAYTSHLFLLRLARCSILSEQSQLCCFLLLKRTFILVCIEWSGHVCVAVMISSLWITEPPIIFIQITSLVSCFSHHGKLNSFSFLTKGGHCWIRGWAIPLNSLLNITIMCFLKDVTSPLYAFIGSCTRTRNSTIKLEFNS